jgi:hypothetical protein
MKALERHPGDSGCLMCYSGAAMHIQRFDTKNIVTDFHGICLDKYPLKRYNNKAFSKNRGIAQLVEQWSPKPRAEGSNPSAPAIQNPHDTDLGVHAGFLFCSMMFVHSVDNCCRILIELNDDTLFFGVHDIHSKNIELR